MPEQITEDEVIKTLFKLKEKGITEVTVYDVSNELNTDDFLGVEVILDELAKKGLIKEVD